MKLGFYKINGDAIADPTFATDGSACFDLRADLTVATIKGFMGQDTKCQLSVLDTGEKKYVVIPADPHARWMIPTGLIFDIPNGYHLKAFMRGGTGLKRGIRLANGTGIIDDDYVNETALLLQNLSGSILHIEHNERLCQAMLEKNIETELERINAAPVQKTTRTGGYNSTGRN